MAHKRTQKTIGQYALFQFEQDRIDNGTCLGPGGCYSMMSTACRRCGWNKQVHDMRVYAIRKGQMAVTPDGLRYLELEAQGDTL